MIIILNYYCEHSDIKGILRSLYQRSQSIKTPLLMCNLIKHSLAYFNSIYNPTDYMKNAITQ